MKAAPSFADHSAKVSGFSMPSMSACQAARNRFASRSEGAASPARVSRVMARSELALSASAASFSFATRLALSSVMREAGTS